MSRHNYSQYSNKKRDNAEAVVHHEEETPVEIKMELTEPVAETVVEPVVETVTKHTGTVANCAKLNVRVAPNSAATVACILDAGSEIEINVAKSTDEWFSVTTVAGIEGYCMRQFVNANL